MKKKGIHPEIDGPAAGMAAYIGFIHEFEQGMQRPLAKKEKEFLKWLTNEYLTQNEAESQVMHSTRSKSDLEKKAGLTGYLRTR
ncbi:MAG TPA: hypothetical protein VFK33_01730 [Bacillales bacterium]|nr:hypothetical protein [Bacillales bacterium]